MRSITKATAEAFNYNKEMNAANTQVVKVGKEIHFKLFNNLIAVKTQFGGIKITTAGFKTATTKERLNGILYYCNTSCSVYQKDHMWYIKGVEVDPMKWTGQWVYVA